MFVSPERQQHRPTAPKKDEILDEILDLRGPEFDSTDGCMHDGSPRRVLSATKTRMRTVALGGRTEAGATAAESRPDSVLAPVHGIPTQLQCVRTHHCLGSDRLNEYFSVAAVESE